VCPVCGHEIVFVCDVGKDIKNEHLKKPKIKDIENDRYLEGTHNPQLHTVPTT
jgi:hypothetical protein